MSRLASAFSTILLLALAALLAFSPLDTWLDATMPRIVLLQMPAWILLGWLVGRKRGNILVHLDPRGLGALAFAILTVIFWMIPRSIDTIGYSTRADQLLHASLFIAGFALADGFPRLPFVAKAALCIMGTSHVFALGVFYTKYTALLCGSFSLLQQQELGHWLLRLTPFVLVWALVGAFRALARAAEQERKTARL
ncbi:MAG: hypothetical protein M9910_05200 [Kiritimatiellae bacterium]|nr:hypothetical protein [Kiritimatiellia bacterium]